jgi:hypothetical protein
MNINEVMVELENYGNENTKNTLGKHGAKEPFFGGKVEMDGTACKVPLATDYIAKAVKMNRVGKKRK